MKNQKRVLISLAIFMSLGSISSLSYAAQTATVSFGSTVANECNITAPTPQGTLTLSGTIDQVLSSENSGGSPAVVNVKCKGFATVNVGAPTPTGSTPTGLPAESLIAKIMNGATVIAKSDTSGGSSTSINFNPSYKDGQAYNVHMSMTSSNTLPPGSYGYNVVVSITPN